MCVPWLWQQDAGSSVIIFFYICIIFYIVALESFLIFFFGLIFFPWGLKAFMVSKPLLLQFMSKIFYPISFFNGWAFLIKWNLTEFINSTFFLENCIIEVFLFVVPIFLDWSYRFGHFRELMLLFYLGIYIYILVIRKYLRRRITIVIIYIPRLLLKKLL